MLGPCGAFMHMHLAILHQFFCGCRRAVNKFDKCTGQFPGMGIRLPDCPGKSHRIMPKQRFLDFRRVNVMPTANDQVLGPAGYPEISVRIDPPQIPGPQMRAVIVEIDVLFFFGIGMPIIDTGI